MSKIKNGGLDQYGAGPIEQQQIGTAGVEGVNKTENTQKKPSFFDWWHQDVVWSIRKSIDIFASRQMTEDQQFQAQPSRRWTKQETIFLVACDENIISHDVSEADVYWSRQNTAKSKVSMRKTVTWRKQCYDGSRLKVPKTLLIDDTARLLLSRLVDVLTCAWKRPGGINRSSAQHADNCLSDIGFRTGHRLGLNMS